ncbi:MAG: hypothetical protein ACRYFS_14050 [Janthinobacterium lividum]
MEHGTTGLTNTTGNVAEIISGFTSPAPPSLGDYRFGAHLTSYLGTLVAASPLTLAERADASGIGTAKFPKFESAWVRLTRPIPRLWFAAVGGDYSVLDQAVENDVRAYDAVSDMAQPAAWFTERLIPAFYRRQLLPKGLSETEAVEYLFERARTSRFASCLGCSGIRTYWFWADRGYSLDLHRPTIKLTRAWIIIGGESMTPTSRIG